VAGVSQQVEIGLVVHLGQFGRPQIENGLAYHPFARNAHHLGKSLVAAQVTPLGIFEKDRRGDGPQQRLVEAQFAFEALVERL
jgi:hypothetical protein